ncbi:MAG: TfoX/Sxy family DNA transformation protein [Sediminibacterium sp.]
MSDLSEIKNFGPYMVKIMHEIGIFTKEDLMNTDYRQIKAALINKGIHPHLNVFYSIEMGLQDRVWSDITLQEKKEIQEILKQT